MLNFTLYFCIFKFSKVRFAMKLHEELKRKKSSMNSFELTSVASVEREEVEPHLYKRCRNKFIFTYVFLHRCLHKFIMVKNRAYELDSEKRVVNIYIAKFFVLVCMLRIHATFCFCELEDRTQPF